MTHRLLNDGKLMKITLALAIVSFYLAGMTRGVLSAVLASFGFISITTLFIVVMLWLLTRD